LDERPPQYTASRRYRVELALSHELHEGEIVLWRGMQTAALHASYFLIYLFAIPWTAFAMFWTVLAWAGISSMDTSGADGIFAWAFPLSGLSSIAVGVGMTATTFLPWWERDTVMFAITNQRVLKLRLGRVLTPNPVPRNSSGRLTAGEPPAMDT